MRKNLFRAGLLAMSLSTGGAFASILPPNDLHLEDGLYRSNVSEEEFMEAIDLAEKVYAPLIKNAFNANLKVNRLWSNSTVNASASQFGRTWNVNMYGGLARRPEVTIDGFTLVLCHELGHHLAGYPFSSSWAANEGQSDYFATLSCARLLWQDDFELNATFRDGLPETPKQLCDEAWDAVADQNLCYRMMAAGKSLADLLSALRNSSVSFDTPDMSRVSRTNNSHPEGQCRLDTYMAGALCQAEFDPEFIPGKSFGSRRNSASAESESAKYTCSVLDGYESGLRPNCWFRSVM
ncbi:MAG: hypothetical protein ACOH5I_08465 [Oligoflexus sp.]